MKFDPPFMVTGVAKLKQGIIAPGSLQKQAEVGHFPVEKSEHLDMLDKVIRAGKFIPVPKLSIQIFNHMMRLWMDDLPTQELSEGKGEQDGNIGN